MKRLLLILIILLDIQLALADERPKWASHTPADTAKSLFFVGRSPKVSSEAEGLRMASKDAKEQLLRQEFGTTVKVDTTQTETLRDVSLDSQLSEISDLIRLRGFKQTEVYAEKENNEVEVWALFSVPKSEIKAEKGRIAEIREEKKRIAEIKRQQVKLANSVPRKENEPPPKPFNSGGKPKLRKGLKKSQVIAMFGKPRSVDHVFSESFRYNKSKYCQTILNFSCSVYFDDQGRVYGWSDFRPEYITHIS